MRESPGWTEERDFYSIAAVWVHEPLPPPMGKTRNFELWRSVRSTLVGVLPFDAGGASILMLCQGMELALGHVQVREMKSIVDFLLFCNLRSWMV